MPVQWAEENTEKHCNQLFRRAVDLQNQFDRLSESEMRTEVRFVHTCVQPLARYSRQSLAQLISVQHDQNDELKVVSALPMHKSKHEHHIVLHSVI